MSIPFYDALSWVGLKYNDIRRYKFLLSSHAVPKQNAPKRMSSLPVAMISHCDCGRTPTWTRKLLLVLPVRIELTTSPLPRGCSTTELRQRAVRPEEIKLQLRPQTPRSLPQGGTGRKRSHAFAGRSREVFLAVSAGRNLPA